VAQYPLHALLLGPVPRHEIDEPLLEGHHPVVHDPLVRIIDDHGLIDLQGIEPDVLADNLPYARIPVFLQQQFPHEGVVSAMTYGVRLADVVQKRGPVHELHVDIEPGLS